MTDTDLADRPIRLFQGAADDYCLRHPAARAWSAYAAPAMTLS